jgi:tetratricopeptide (TPR) repeat protein
MKTRAILLCIILIQLRINVTLAQSTDTREQSLFCLGTEVLFDTSGIDAVYKHPDETLCNVDSFWTVNGAYRLAQQYSNNNRITLDRNEWSERVRAIAALSQEERSLQPAFVTSREIMELRTVLHEKGLPHISSFLQPSAPPLKVTVYLISDIKPAAFAYPGGILVNVNSPRFNNDPSVIMNIIVHEVYHGGYANTIAYRTDYELQNEALDFVMDFLLNEGMATYVSYSARDIFPNDFVPDYQKMESREEVKRNIEKVDLLFKQAETLTIDSLRRAAWQTGVIGRAFYIAGGYMAGLIDKTMGRDQLVRAMSAGPISFLTLYNSVADDTMKIKVPELPGEISPCQRMRLALAKEDTTEFRRLANGLIQSVKADDETVEKAINRYGYMFLRSNGGTDEALELFYLNAKLFPGSSRVWDSLGEGSMSAGNKDLAIEYYEKSLALNPSNENARRVLEKLRQ